MERRETVAKLVVAVLFAGTVVATAETRKEFHFKVHRRASVSVANQFGPIWVKPSSGEEVVVTERGTPIAKIVPVVRSPATLPASLAALEQAGLVTRGSGHVPDEVWALPARIVATDSVSIHAP